MVLESGGGPRLIAVVVLDSSLVNVHTLDMARIIANDEDTDMSTTRTTLLMALSQVFGSEWNRTTEADRTNIANDCIAYGVADLDVYRRNIGYGNLASYCECLAVNPGELARRAASVEELDAEEDDTELFYSIL